MSNIRWFCLPILAASVVACKIDSLPQRPSNDGATEAGKVAVVDASAGLDGGQTGSPHVDSSGSVDAIVGYDGAADSPMDLPLGPLVDVGAEQGPDTRSDLAATLDSKPQPGPETGPQVASDAGIGVASDVRSGIVVDTGIDTGPDTTANSGPDAATVANLGVGKTGTGKGTVTSSPAGIACADTCSASFALGTVVTLTPVADATSTFTGWSGSCSGTGSCVVTVDAAKSVTANFDVLQQGLNVAKTGAGGGLVTSLPTGISCGGMCLANFPMDTQVTLTATPDALSAFAGWSGACSGTTATCTITSDAAKSVTASFVKAAGTACAATGECQAGLTCLDSVCCTQSSCPQCHNCGVGGTCNVVVVNADDTTGLTCSGTNSCDATGSCKTKSGQACSVAGDCASGSCTDSHCCTQSCGTCQACTGAGGTCVAVTNADDADTCTGNNTCDASGACKKKPGQGCGAGTECATGNCLDGVCCTQSSCPQCQNCGATGTCSITVTSADDTTGAVCSIANTCDATGVCKKANGQTCAGGAECASGNCGGPVGSALCSAAGPLQWRPVAIPSLPAGANLVGLWTGARGDVYVMATLIAAVEPKMPETWIFHRTVNGTWSTLLHLSDSYGSSWGIWGTGPTDIFLAVVEYPTGTSGGCGGACTAQIYHSSDGTTFTRQTLPTVVGGNALWQFGGAPNDVYIAYGVGVLHYQGGSWSVAHDCQASGNSCGPLAYIGPNEIYTTECWGYSAFDGSNWTFYRGFDFCDVNNMWGLRDTTGLHLYVTGANNFGNGEKVWQFTQTGAVGVGSWGSKYGYIQQDCNATWCGFGGTLWGSAANDIWVTAADGASTSPWLGGGGRIYHYNGSAWSKDTTIGLGTFSPFSLWGTATDDVWVAVQDDSTSSTKAPSQLFHYGYVP